MISLARVAPLQKKTALTDPYAEETANVLFSMREEADERLTKLTSIFTKREYERVERERELLREVVQGCLSRAADSRGVVS